MPVFMAPLFLILAFMATVGSTAHAAVVVINEFQASNGETIADEDGDFEDWIELYNAGENTALLDGYGLSDDEAAPFRWVIPDRTLEPGERLLIFASGKDRADGPALHANFSIAAAGEPILLTAPDGLLLDFVPPTPVPRDVSFGRAPDGAGAWVFFANPTPGAPNAAEGYLGTLDPPHFSHEGGFHTEAFSLIIEPPAAGATVYYTLDGSMPDGQNLDGTTYYYKQSYPFGPDDALGAIHAAQFRTHAYAGPLAIEDRSSEPDRLTQRATTYHVSPDHYVPGAPVFKGAVVRARAEMPGYLPSPVVTHTYFVTPEGAERFSLPVLSLVTQEDHLFGYEDGIHTAGMDFDLWRQENPNNPTISVFRPANYNRRGPAAERPVSLELFDGGGGAALRQNLGVRIHGAATRSHPQKSMRLYARSRYDCADTLQYPFFPDLRDRVSGAPITEFDAIILRTSGNDSARDPLSHGGVSATRIRDAMLQRLLQPLGLDDQAYAPAIHFINGEYWGLINLRERIDPHTLGRRHEIDPDDIIILSGIDEIVEGTVAERQEWLDLRAYIASHDMRDPDYYAFVADRMDLDNFIRYKLGQIYIKNNDWPGQNIDYWRKRTPDRGIDAPPAHDGRWRWALYDLDMGFGPWSNENVSHDTLHFATEMGSTHYANPDASTVVLRNLLENEDFQTRFIIAASDHMNSTFLPERVDALVDEMYGRIAPYLPEHVQRWPHTGNTSPQFLKNFGRLRPAYMRQHIVNYFGLEGIYELTIAMPPEGSARVRVNSIELEAHGGQWRGVYFLGMPLEVEIIPEFAHEFLGWHEAFEGEGNLLSLTPGADLTLAPIVKDDGVTLHEVILPRFMQGESPDNNDRVPYSARLRIEGLLPNALYRYANRVVTPDDPPMQNGAGNAVYHNFATGQHFRTTATPDFAEPGTYGEFVTDDNGVYEGWFTLEPSGNPRFGEPELFIRVLLNDGLGGEEYRHFLTTQSAVQVLPFGFGWEAATGVYATSSMAPGNVAVLHDDFEGAGRPLTATLVEKAGFEVDERYATFYEQFVTGIDGHFGTLLPNLLPAGLQRIEEFAWDSGDSEAVYTRPDGNWPDNANTVNPNGGLDFPLALILGEPDATLQGDVNGDGVVNAVDVQLVINAALGVAIDPAYRPDINGDGVVNAVDVQLVISAALGAGPTP